MSGSKRLDDERVVAMAHDYESGEWLLTFQYREKNTVVRLSAEAMDAVVEGYYAHKRRKP